MESTTATTPLTHYYFKVYPRRFLVVVLFSLVQMMTSVLLNTLTAIAAYLAIIYDYETVVVNLGGLLFALMHPIFTFPAAYVIDTYGARVGITVGSVLCLIGISTRLLVNQAFAWVIVGQVIAGIGRPFILNCQAKISANWFTAYVRGTVTQLFTLILNISLILGLFLPSIVFRGYYPITVDDDTNNIAYGKDLTFKVMLVQAIMGAVCFGLNIIFQSDKPPTPPSASSNFQRYPFTVAIPKMLCNRNYLLLLIAFGCYFGIFNGISIVLSYMLKPWFGGYGQNLSLDASIVGGSPIISGIIGVIIIGQLQRKSKYFKKYIIICMLGSSLAIVLFYPFLYINSLLWASFISAFNSFFLIPLVPIMLELGCYIAFPVGYGSAVGLLFANGNFFGFLLGLFLSLIVKGYSKGQTAAGLGFCFAIFLIGLGLIIFMKYEQNRSDYYRSSDSRQSDQDLSQRRSSMLSSDKYSLGKKERLEENSYQENSIL